MSLYLKLFSSPLELTEDMKLINLVLGLLTLREANAIKTSATTEAEQERVRFTFYCRLVNEGRLRDIARLCGEPEVLDIVVDDDETDETGSAPATIVDPSDNNGDDDDEDSEPTMPLVNYGTDTVDDYRSEINALFPFMFVDFAVPETHPNQGVNVVTPGPETYYESEPEQCSDPCAELSARVDFLENENKAYALGLAELTEELSAIYAANPELAPQ